MRKKRMILIALMVLYAGVMVWMIQHITDFKDTMNVYREAENDLFFDVFPDAEARPLSKLHGLIGRENEDLFGYGKKDPTYSRLSSKEEEEIREILSETRIRLLRPDDPRYAESSIGGFLYTFGFRKYTMNVYRQEGDICLRMTGETGDYRLACYAVEDREQGERLLEALDKASENHPEPEMWQDEEAFRKAVGPKHKIWDTMREWNHAWGFSVVSVLRIVFAAGEVLFLLLLMSEAKKEGQRRNSR